MDLSLRDRFIALWREYFADAELPVAYYYSDRSDDGDDVMPSPKHRCFISDLAGVRAGRTRVFNRESLSCGGATYYMGFCDRLRPGIEDFLSKGTPEMEGERYKETPELAAKAVAQYPTHVAELPYVVFKRWDKLDEGDPEPQVVVFFSTPDVLSGLFTWANFDTPDLEGVIAPFTAGCGAIGKFPLAELERPTPRAVLGMFDVSARPSVQPNVLSFAIPWPRFTEMLGKVEESFFITDSWARVKARIKRNTAF